MKQTIKYAAIAGVLASVALSVPEARAELKHRYQFNDSPGSTAVVDSINGRNGTLVNTTGNSLFDGNKLTLGNDGSQFSNGTNGNLGPGNPQTNIISVTGDYVDLPNGLITDLNTGAGNTQFTFEAWFTRTGNGTWMRVWDFGTSQAGEGWSNSGDQVAQTFLSAQSGAGSIRAAWRPDAGVEDPILDRPGVAPLDQLMHAAFVWDETTTSARLYINGALVSQSTTVPTTLAGGFFDEGLPLDVNNFLGRAQWPDPLFVGSFDEFRIWDEALTAQTILDNYANGPDDPDQQGAGAGALTSIDATSDGIDVVINATTQVSVIATYENASIPVTSDPAIIYTSGSPGVATVNATGVVTGAGPGTTQITATYQGQSDMVSVTVVVPPRPPATIAHRYQFNETAGATTVADSVGTADGEARGITFNGTEAVLDPSTQSHINLPNGIISSHENVTIESWVTITGTGGAWQRVYDIGSNTSGIEDPSPLPEDPGYNGAGDSTYLFYAPRRGGIGNLDGGRFTFRNGTGEVGSVDPGAEGRMIGGEKAHLVTIFNYAQRQTQVWLDGALVGQNTIPSGSSLDLLNDINVWLGRSQYKDDSFMSGSFDEFRIYDGAMSPLEIAASGAAGPDVAELIGDPGDPLSFAITAETSTAVQNGTPVPVSLVADFSAIAGVNITGVPGATLASSNPDVIQVLENPYRIVPVGQGTAQVTGSYNGQTATPLSFTVTPDNRPLMLEHRYTFDSNANDTGPVGGLNGALVSTNANQGGVFEDGGLTLTGAGYVNLPNFLFSDYWYDNTGTVPTNNLTAVTLEVFGSRAAGNAWQRIFSFGTTTDQTEDPVIGTAYNGGSLVFLTPSSGPGTLRFTGTDGTSEFAQINDTALGASQDFHAVVVFDPNVGVVRLYRNGELSGVTTLPATIRQQLLDGLAVFDNNVWLGRSQFSADPFFQGRFEEFRIWRGAMSQAKVAENFACGPNNPDGCSLPGPAPSIEPGLNGNAITLSWPEAALGFGLESTTTVGDSDSWNPVAAQPLTTDGTRTTTLTPAEPTIFRLKADN